MGSAIPPPFTMVFKRFVEIGRVAVINGPSSITGVQRQAIPFKRLALTDLKIKIQKSPRLKSLVKAYTEAGIQEKWEATSWAKKIALRKKRAALNDFDRFKVMLAKKEKSRVVRQELRKLTKEFHKKENDARVAAKKQ